MSDVIAEPKIDELSAKVDDMVLGLKWMFSLLLIVTSIPIFFTSLAIPHFAEIFREALPGKPLPLLTVAVISHPTFHHLLALILPVVGIFNIVYSNRIRNWAIGTALIAFFIGLQLYLTQAALFMPMTDLIMGMPDTTAK